MTRVGATRKLIGGAALMLACASPGRAYEWEPQPDKAVLLVVSTHPDDEGIFFGGLIPYYTQVAWLPLVHICMTSGDYVRPPEVREAELCCADWTYGLRNPPLFPRFRDWPTLTLDGTWDLWADGVFDGDDIAEGRAIATAYVAQQIRRFRPEVVITHDFDGETGHFNHRATALATTDAWVLAADPDAYLGGLEPWQAKKLYTHLYDRPPTHPMINELRHDWSTPYPELGGLTALEVTDLGLCCHVTQGGCYIPVYYAGLRHCDHWGLYQSVVGSDTLDPNGVARGDFLEHITLEPCPGDVNNDGYVDLRDLCVLQRRFGTSSGASWYDGDSDLDGDVDLADESNLCTALGSRCPNPPNP